MLGRTPLVQGDAPLQLSPWRERFAWIRSNGFVASIRKQRRRVLWGLVWILEDSGGYCPIRPEGMRYGSDLAQRYTRDYYCG